MKKIFILLLFNFIFLNAQEKIEVLDEVVVMGQQLPKYNTKQKTKGHTYFTRLANNDIKMLSSHYQRKTGNLVGIKFVFDASELKSDIVFVRPLILKEDMQEVIDSSKQFPLTETTKEIVFSFSTNPIKLQASTNYYIGFEILDKENTHKIIKIYAVNSKNTHSLIKTTSNWFRQDNAPHGYSLYYELFFVN